MKITLQVNGREMIFSKKELEAIVEKYLSSETIEETSTAKVAPKPTEGMWFEVKPLAIDQKLFQKERKNNKQETARRRICEAFAKVNAKPEKYGKNFKTMMPNKTWNSMSVKELIELASNLGDHNANWVEQALEWAQRIANGESWETICNNDDTANWYRLVVWTSGNLHRVGGSVYSRYNSPASVIHTYTYIDKDTLKHTVPLVVLYE